MKPKLDKKEQELSNIFILGMIILQAYFMLKPEELYYVHRIDSEDFLRRKYELIKNDKIKKLLIRMLKYTPTDRY